MDEFIIERDYWLAFSICYGIGPSKFHLLFKAFGSAENAWNASVAVLAKSGIGPKTAERVDAFRQHYSFIQSRERLERLQIWYVTLAESDYPELLKKSQHPPFLLYGKGDQSLLQHPTNVAVVGTRKITDYGRQVTALLVHDLAAAGCCIVSGLAMGIDAIAHQAALDASGKTVAVLGSGVDVCTPQENSVLYNRILTSGGAIVSETPPGQLPNKGSFPSRNRIIAGLSQGVVVTEGAEDSGSLITAHDGFKNNRKVFAVPGPITSSVSKGPIALIAEGAVVVTSAQDVLRELRIENKEVRTIKKKKKGDTKEEQIILDLLENESLPFDEISKRSGLTTSQVGIILSLLEMKGVICSQDGSKFSLM